MPRIKTRAVCLRKIDYSETSQIVWLFTPEHGRVSVMAKGAKRSTSNRPGLPLDTAAYYEVIYYDKPGAELANMAEYTLLDLFPGLRRNLHAYYHTLYILEICRHVVQPGVEATDFFDALLMTLATIANGRHDRLPLLYFELQTLNFLGALPDVSGCVHCGRKLPREQRPESLTFSVRGGGLVCKHCRQTDPTSYACDRKAVATYESMLHWGLPVAAIPMDIKALGQLVQPLFISHFDRPLTMRSFCWQPVPATHLPVVATNGG